MLVPLTRRQKEILDYLNLYYDINHVAPSLEEIRDHFKLKAVSTVHEHLERLKSKGYITKEMNQARGIRTTDPNEIGERLVEINILGRIAAGQPIETVENPEPFLVTADLVPKHSNYFGLIVVGDSMIEDGIFPDDVVVVKSQSTANNGDTVVAVVDDDGEFATLKKIYKEKDRFRLQPANEKLKPMFYRNVQVRGKVVALVRKYS